MASNAARHPDRSTRPVRSGPRPTVAHVLASRSRAHSFGEQVRKRGGDGHAGFLLQPEPLSGGIALQHDPLPSGDHEVEHVEGQRLEIRRHDGWVWGERLPRICQPAAAARGLGSRREQDGYLGDRLQMLAEFGYEHDA
jgi:hypothetical protein